MWKHLLTLRILFYLPKKRNPDTSCVTQPQPIQIYNSNKISFILLFCLFYYYFFFRLQVQPFATTNILAFRFLFILLRNQWNPTMTLTKLSSILWKQILISTFDVQFATRPHLVAYARQETGPKHLLSPSSLSFHFHISSCFPIPSLHWFLFILLLLSFWLRQKQNYYYFKRILLKLFISNCIIE